MGAAIWLQLEIGATFTKIAKPTLQCMFEPAN